MTLLGQHLTKVDMVFRLARFDLFRQTRWVLRCVRFVLSATPSTVRILASGPVFCRATEVEGAAQYGTATSSGNLSKPGMAWRRRLQSYFIARVCRWRTHRIFISTPLLSNFCCNRENKASETLAIASPQKRRLACCLLSCTGRCVLGPMG
jgi:hypothetical protein